MGAKHVLMASMWWSMHLWAAHFRGRADVYIYVSFMYMYRRVFEEYLQGIAEYLQSICRVFAEYLQSIVE